MRLILASQSPRRTSLLQRLGIPFDVQPAEIEEAAGDGESPEQTCRRLAREKAGAVADLHPESLVIGSDTIVLLDDALLGKPANLTEARSMLRSLADRTHLVKTAVSMQCRDRGLDTEFVESTAVSFGKVTDEDIALYLETDPPLDKAGAYGIQDFSGVFVDRIEGCYHNVMGFPLARFYRHLRETGIWPELQSRNNL
ncbi:MAG: septum formation protein Maf [Candidatus Marinimicrobia bacterium]|nr:septum formation protein Maf [Candidatus Neomarinimicrobiota bacterium]